MWQVKNTNSHNTDLPLIVGEPSELLSYDDIPVLYTGVNSLGNRILGSFIREDGGVQEYFHSIIDHATYASYVNQKINYLTALAKAKAIFVIQRHCDDVRQVIPVNFADIPQEYLPLESSQCPEFEASPALTKIEEASGKTVIKDAEPQTYKIYIYDLNTDTRTGRALSPHPTEKDKFVKPSIRISGAGALPGTKYTASLHLDKMIEVKGRGTKVDDILKSLEIIYEE